MTASDDLEDTQPANDAHYESERYGFKPGALAPRDAGDAEEPEFEDLPPRAYLGELQFGPGATALAAAITALTVSIAALVAALEPWTELATAFAVLVGGSEIRDLADASPPWVAPLGTVWSLLPGVAIAGFFITGFVRMNVESATRARVRLMTWAVILHLASCVIWAVARWRFDIGF